MNVKRLKELLDKFPDEQKVVLLLNDDEVLGFSIKKGFGGDNSLEVITIQT